MTVRRAIPDNGDPVMEDRKTMCRPERMAPLLRGPERDAVAAPAHIQQNAHLDGGVT
jgi:hypothetical protein